MPADPIILDSDDLSGVWLTEILYPRQNVVIGESKPDTIRKGLIRKPRFNKKPITTNSGDKEVPLAIVLRPGEQFIINGAKLLFHQKARFSIVRTNTDARFMYGKQILNEEDVKSLEQQIYYAIQQAYVSETALERSDYLTKLHSLLTKAKQQYAKEVQDITSFVANREFYPALKIACEMIKASESGQNG